MSLCNHFSKLKIIKIADNLKAKNDLTTCKAKHDKKNDNDDPSNCWVCLECLNVGCSRYSANECSLKHFKESKHTMSINPINLMIWCYECDDDLDSIKERGDPVKDKPNIEKIDKFKEDIGQLFFNKMKVINKDKNIVIMKETGEIQDKNEKPIHFAGSKVVFGLKNIGNTCFFNSVMQCLNATKSLARVYLDEGDLFIKDLKPEQIEQNTMDEINNEGWITVGTEKKNKDKGKGGNASGNKSRNKSDRNISTSSVMSVAGPLNMSKKFQEFLIQARNSKNHVHDPSNIFTAISHIFSRFRGYAQQDAQELLRYFLDALSSCEEKMLSKIEISKAKEQKKRKITFVETIFGCFLSNYLKCLDCHHVSRTFDFCLDIALNIYKEPKKIVKPNVVVPPITTKKGTKGKPQDKIEQNVDQQDSVKENEPDKTPGNDNNTATTTVIPEDASKEEKKENDPFQGKKYRIVDINELANVNISEFDKDIHTLVELNMPISKPKPENIVTLIDCLDEFTSFEILNKQNNYYKCENCEKMKKISSGTLRRFYIYDPPQILTLVLKRFKQTSANKFEKINTTIKFEEKLVLDPYVLKKVKKNEIPKLEQFDEIQYPYELYGVVEHSGNLNGGHYVAYTKHIINGEDMWFHYSDTHFKPVKKETVLKSQPYILFYELKSSKK